VRTGGRSRGARGSGSSRSYASSRGWALRLERLDPAARTHVSARSAGSVSNRDVPASIVLTDVEGERGP
jgi:hypothetical protein